MIVLPTTGDDDVAMTNAMNLQREQQERLHELLHVPNDGGGVSHLAASSSDANAFASRVGEGCDCEFGTLSDAAAALTIKMLKTMPRSSDYLGNDYAHVPFLVATAVRQLNIHITTDPQQKAKLKKDLCESLLAPDSALNFCPGYGNKKEPQKNYASLFNYVMSGIKHDDEEYDQHATEPDFDSDEYNLLLAQKLSHTIMQEAAAADSGAEGN
jgi:hypothetical protein